MSQIWQIYLCKNIKKLGQKVCGNTKQVIFWAHFNNYSGIFLQNSLQDTMFGIFALKFAFYAHIILQKLLAIYVLFLGVNLVRQK